MINNLVFKLPQTSNNKLNSDSEEVLFSNNINQPQINLGFQYFLHRTKNSMSITKNISTKNKFYYVVNPYEHKITNYDKDLSNMTNKYFNQKKSDPKILSRAFYKLWEILFVFDLASEDKLTYAALAEGPGAFIQAVIKFRESFYSTKKDRIFGVTIHPEKGKFIEMGKKFMNYYKEKSPKLLRVHKTYTLEKSLKKDTRDNGDITNVKTILNFKKDIIKSKKLANLVTADGGFDWKDENYQEQEAYKLILGQSIAALRVQDKNGSFVLKLFESFTDITLRILYLLSSFYSERY